jgi:hypothetical protein
LQNIFKDSYLYCIEDLIMDRIFADGIQDRMLLQWAREDQEKSAEQEKQEKQQIELTRLKIMNSTRNMARHHSKTKRHKRLQKKH